MHSLYLSGLLLLFTTTLIGQESVARLRGLEAQVDSLMQVCQTVGMAISIIEGDQLIYSKGFGYRHLPQKLPVTPSTVFPIGSITKPLTASLIGVLEGRGKLRVTDRPRQYIPYLEFASTAMNELITIEDLLAHRSGIGNVDGTHVFFPLDEVEAHLKRLPYLPPSSSVRERFEYSNMGYAILGEICARTSQKNWAETMQSELFTPLGMINSSCTLSALQRGSNYATGYSLSAGKIVPVEYEDQHESAASGAVNSSCEDLAQWVNVLLNGGTFRGIQMISSSYLERSFSEQTIIRGSFNFDRKYDLIADSYGYGWFVHQYKNAYRINHEGNISGFTASINLYPYHQIGIIILTNQGAANELVKAVNEGIIKRLLEEIPENGRNDRIEVGEASLPLHLLAPINAQQQPTHALGAYVGSYRSKGYGTAKVSLEGAQLMIQFPAFKMALEHQQYNTFINRIIESHHQNAPSFYINFSLNHAGDIKAMSIAFGPEPEVFVKIE